MTMKLTLVTVALTAWFAFEGTTTMTTTTAFLLLPQTPTRRTPARQQQQRRQQSVPTKLYRKSDSKWDNLVDDDDEDDGAGTTIPARTDMKYIPRNVQRQHQNFVALREAGGPEITHDIYVPEPKTNEFWFVGKIASVSDVTPAQAVARQWALIEMHASNLRPIELFPHRGNLEIWMAPGDSELDVAYNRPHIVFEKMQRTGGDVEGAEALKSSMVGFQGEIYESRDEGMGFRTWRTPYGKASKPEIQSPDPSSGGLGADGEEEEEYSDPKYRSPTDEELEKLQAYLKENNMNLDELYQQQQELEKKKEKEE